MAHHAVRAEPTAPPHAASIASIADAPPQHPQRTASLVDAYITATFSRFERVLVAQLPALAEPAVADPGRASRQVGFLVETLVGFAVGSAFGCVATAVRRSFGKDVRDALDDLVGKLKYGTALTAVPDTRGAPSFLGRRTAEHKPLLDALGSQLQARLCHAAGDARRHVHAIRELVARVAPEQAGFFANTLTTLVDDDAAALAFGDQLGFGWSHFVAAVLRAPAPQIPSSPRWQRTSSLWRTWYTKVSGKPVLAELTQDQVTAAGFVMRIG